jgi:ABC-type Fe3+-citrate transport system substrate-binding protein
VRLGIKEDVLLLNETHLEKIIKLAKEIKPKVMLKSSLAHCKYANFIDCAKTIFYVVKGVLELS